MNKNETQYYVYFRERLDEDPSHDGVETIGPFASSKEAKDWCEKTWKLWDSWNYRSLTVIPDEDTMSPKAFFTKEKKFQDELRSL